MKLPTISVVLPVYNRAALLPLTVRSVFAQTCVDWELLIADDGSTDGTRRLFAEWLTQPRVRVLELAHTGNPAQVRNAALSAARGEFIAFLDSDDLWMPEKLERQLALHRSQPARAWSYTGFIHVDASGHFIDDGARERFAPHDGHIFEAAITGRAQIRTPGVMVRRELLAAAGGFDEGLISGHDYDLWTRLALRSEAGLLVAPLVAVRVHANSHSSAWPPRALECRELSLRKISALAGPDWRDRIDRQRRRNAAALAACYLEQGARRQMLNAMRRNLVLCWRDPRWWASSARTLFRGVFAAPAAGGDGAFV